MEVSVRQPAATHKRTRATCRDGTRSCCFGYALVGMNLLLFEPSAVAGDGTVRLSAAQAAHVLDVLKAGPGDSVRVGVIDGAMGLGTVASVIDRCVELRCAFGAAVPERPRVDLLLALPRPKVMRRLWAQLAALGVGQVLLTNAGKVERDYFGSHLLHEGTYRPLLIEGLQQARDTRLPTVSVHRRFRVLVEDDLDRLCPGARRIAAHPGGQRTGDASIAAALAGIGHGDRVLVAIGPEGGWSDFELTLLETHGFARVGLGPRTLSTTTACIAILAIVHEALRGSRPAVESAPARHPAPGETRS
jgi:16S rRNA (uracil1498-N3)-methyltransferase